MGDIIADFVPDFLWSVAAFLVFVVLLLRWALRPILKALDARDAHIAKQIADADAIAQRNKRLQGELDEKMAGAEARIAALIQTARGDGEALKASLAETGRKDLDNLRNRALREIEAARHEAIVHLRAEVAEIATDVASRILKTQIDAQRHQDLVAEAIDAYEARLASEEART